MRKVKFSQVHYEQPISEKYFMYRSGFNQQRLLRHITKLLRINLVSQIKPFPGTNEHYGAS
jgi:hypothetical protein